jgi:type IV secretory pathway VirB10-like protein
MSLPVPIRMTPSRAGWPTAVVVAALSLAATGCTRKVIAAAPPPVPLAVPSVPPRIVGPVVVPEERPQPVAEAPAIPEQRPAPRPARRPPDPAAETAVEDPQRARVEGAEPAASPATPAPLLRTRETANDVEAAKKVQDMLRRAEQNLARVNYRGLSANGKQQADTARRFITQAGDALKARQLTFALSLADKAEALSTALVNR